MVITFLFKRPVQQLFESKILLSPYKLIQTSLRMHGMFVLVYFFLLAFDFLFVDSVIRFFHPRHNGQ